MIDERFADGASAWMMMKELDRLVAANYSEDEESSDEDKDAVDADIDEILICMEDLICAVNLAER